MDTLALARAAASPQAAGERACLAALRPGDRGLIEGIEPEGPAHVALERRLLELGFVQGEPFEVLAEARPGRDPFVIRLGQTTLAMRRSEAHCVRVRVTGRLVRE